MTSCSLQQVTKALLSLRTRPVQDGTEKHGSGEAHFPFIPRLSVPPRRAPIVRMAALQGRAHDILTSGMHGPARSKPMEGHK